MKLRILITGGNGLVGSQLSSYLKNTYTVFSPSHKEQDITNPVAIETYLSSHSPDVIIHAAACTDNTKAERESGDKNGLCWRTNVDGSRFIAQAAKQIGAFVIYMSTGSVFSGTSGNPGPFTENDPVAPSSWYGYTKSYAESYIHDGAVIRISHPLCNDKRDYLQKLIELYDSQKLYPLFTDQVFPVTDIHVLARAIEKIAHQKRTGVFHIASSDLVSPYELLRYTLMVSRGINPVIEPAVFHAESRRFSQFSAIRGIETMKTLGLTPYSWKDVIDSIYTNI